jgi:hypothetical protein
MEVVKDVSSKDSVVSDEPALYKSTLVLAYYVRENMLDSIGNGFGNDLLGNIAQGNGPKVTGRDGGVRFRN